MAEFLAIALVSVSFSSRSPKSPCILLADLAKGEEFRQYAGNWRVIPSSQLLSEFLAEIVIQDNEIDPLKILTDHVILI